MTEPAATIADVARARRRRGMPRPVLGVMAWLRGAIRASELWMVAVAVVVGALSGLAAIAVGSAAHLLQHWLYGIDFDQRLSAISAVPRISLLALPAGGLLLGAVTWLWARRRPTATVDPVEANALH